MNEAGSSWAGVFQTLASTATGYLDRRIDIDLQRRLTIAQVPERTSMQTTIRDVVPAQLGTINLASLLPLLLVAGVALVLLRK